MKPYRDLQPHAGLMLPHTETIAARVIVMPTETTLSELQIRAIAAIVRNRAG